MKLNGILIYIVLGLLAGTLIKYTTGPSIQTYGTDITPPGPAAVSLRIPGSLCDNHDFGQIDRRIERFINRWELAGASVAIAKNGKMVFAKGYGYADKEDSVAVEPYNLFRVASISKLITAAGVMKLVENGELCLDDHVFGAQGILNQPPYNNYTDQNIEKIKVKHLLNHSGGWTNRWGDPMFMPHIVARGLNKDLPVTDEDIISFILAKRLHFKPGTMSAYSNLGYVILGKVIENVSGMGYESFIQSNILFPLEIYDMQIGHSFYEERVKNEVKYYEPDNQPKIADFMGNGMEVPKSYGGNDIATLGAAGGWIASATDLMKFMMAIDDNDYPSNILSKESIKTMTTPVGIGFQPFGWRGASARRWYRTGSFSGTSSMMVKRSDGFSYVVLFNSNNWKGPLLSRDIRHMMDIAIANVQEWPDNDLFELASEYNYYSNNNFLLSQQ